MKNKLFQKVVCLLLSVTLLFGALGITASASSGKYNPEDEHPYVVPSVDDMKDLVGVLSYDEYRLAYADAPMATDVPPVINIIAPTSGNASVVNNSEWCQNAMLEKPINWHQFGDNGGTSVYLPATGSVTWQFNCNENQAGHYFIKITYFNCITGESSVSSIERGFKIDGKVPFDEVATITLNKTWSWSEEDGNIKTETVAAPGEPNSYNVEYKLAGTGDSAGYYKVVTAVKDEVKTVTTYFLPQDINGNSMAPSAVAFPSWNSYYLQDPSGYHSGYFSFYLASGDHFITLEAERDPVIIQSIELIPAVESESIPAYRDILAQYKENGYTAGNGKIEIQAEFPDLISDSSVAPSSNNTSAVTQPIVAGAQLYNVIGSTSYNNLGQWAAYKFRVNSSGLYNFGMRYMQSALQGMFLCRAIKLSGGHYGDAPTTPFLEAYNAEFNYDKEWQTNFIRAEVELLDESGNKYKEDRDLLFYFEEGVEYTVYLECSLGTLKDYIQRVEKTLSNINAAYLEILQLTGADPDENATYNFFGIMPEVLICLLEESQELLSVKQGLEDLCGTNGSHLATLETVAILLDTMGEDDGRQIPANMSTLKSYLGTLGTWINSSKTGSMTVDSIWVIPAKQTADGFVANYDELPDADANFFESLWFEIKSFFYSFVVNYDQMGIRKKPDGKAPTIDVWLADGRDQSQVWRTMIDAHGNYTYSTGTAVSLKLVAGGTLLPSILSGKGPDVYMGLGAADVINYAIRDAVIGISGNDPRLNEEQDQASKLPANSVFSQTYYTYKDENGNVIAPTTEYRGEEGLSFTSQSFDALTCEEAGNFAKSAMDTLTLLDVSYGVPMVMSFAMMFYRMDVLADLEAELPETWSDLLYLLPALQSNNLSMGVAYINALDFMIYQKGGNMWKYTDESKYDSKYAGARVDIDSNIALEAFEFVCSLYGEYSLPVSYDAANRFRTGEMPIIIGDYASLYNQLVVFATEIGGLWGFCSLPGTERADGTINYNSLAGISAAVILHGCDNLLASWQFVQWQTGEEAQAEYGNRMVSILGPSAKYATANLKAINNLSWTATEKAAIMNQMDNMSSIVNYPGSYIIGRYVGFAFLDAVNEDADAIDAMTSYIDAINSEIARKRAEFDLWIPETPEDEPPEKIQQ